MLQKFRGYIIIFSLLLALAAGMVTARVMVAGSGMADLSNSSLSVNKSATIAGGELQYTVVISNSGDTAVNGVIMTDTLPTEVMYQANSLESNEVNAVTNSFGDTGNIITWTGDVESFGSVALSYNVLVSDSVMVNDVIENSIEITGTGTLISRTTSTTITNAYLQMMPLMFTPLPAPSLDPIQGPTASANSWTVSWTEPNPNVTAYQLQEAKSLDFSNAVTFDIASETEKDFSPTLSFDNFYCYRVRAISGVHTSGWSNVECTVGNYFDDMSNSSSGWAIRQEDTDDVDNRSYYENGEFVIKISGRWDYAVASPLAQAPEPPYALESRIAFDPTVDNLHAYGIVFGGNWNGQPCPNSDFSSCFTHYYRLLAIWYGPLDSLRVELKRIDYNDPNNNAGRGVTLDGFNDVYVGNSKGFNTWRIEVEENGTIRILLNGNQVLSAKDSSYINDPYFGIFAASNEYLGTEPHVDWFRATKQ